MNDGYPHKTIILLAVLKDGLSSLYFNVLVCAARIQGFETLMKVGWSDSHESNVRLFERLVKQVGSSHHGSCSK